MFTTTHTHALSCTRLYFSTSVRVCVSVNSGEISLTGRSVILAAVVTAIHSVLQNSRRADHCRYNQNAVVQKFWKKNSNFNPSLRMCLRFEIRSICSTYFRRWFLKFLVFNFKLKQQFLSLDFQIPRSQFVGFFGVWRSFSPNNLFFDRLKYEDY